jgi:hypothetical protein
MMHRGFNGNHLNTKRNFLMDVSLGDSEIQTIRDAYPIFAEYPKFKKRCLEVANILRETSLWEKAVKH